MRTIFRIGIISVLLLTASSCRKELTESVLSAQDNAAMETEYSEIYDVVSDYISNDSKTGKTDDLVLPSGATVTFIDSLLYDGDGIAFTIDYGPLQHGGSNQGILCRDERYRAGKIQVGMTNRWSQTPCVVTIAISSSDNYYVGNGTKMYKLTGLKTITRTSGSSYSVEVTNATLQRENGVANWNSNRIVTQTYDAGIGPWNDVYQITGTASGTNKNGEAFTVEITTPLKKKIATSCLSTFVSGELLLTNSNGKVLSVNYDTYGNEACDKTATVTFNGQSRDIQVW